MIDKIIQLLKFIWLTLAYIVYPPVCPICRQIVDERNELCPSCANKIFQLNLNRHIPDILSGVIRITKYRGGSQQLLHKLKFDNDLSVLPAFHNMLAQIKNSAEIKNFFADIDLATYVPLHADRLKERGYNQVELIFNDWILAQGLTVENLLIRKRHTPKLFSHNAQERKEILRSAFEFAETVDIRGKNILIVDDIYTTGATVCGCAEVLKKAGAAKIFVLAFASDFGEILNA